MIRRSLVLIALNCVMAACISSPAPVIYVLSHAVDSTMEAKPGPGGPVVQLQRVLVPDYLDTELDHTRRT